MNHSILAPSSAYKRVPCNGSTLMEMMHPQIEDTEEAMEGTASHEVGASLIETATVAGTITTLAVGDTASNGIVITPEMFEGAEMYADDVIAVMRSTGVFIPHVEERVEIPDIHEQEWGTPDCWLYHGATGHLYIWDYKYGHGIVEVFENWQAMEYLAGIIPTLPAHDQHLTVHIRIVQPRAPHRRGPIREWVITASDLRPYWNRSHTAAHAALGPNPGTCSGSHCRNCSGIHACETNQQAVFNAIEVIGQTVSLNLDAHGVGLELSILKRAQQAVKDRLSALEPKALAYIEEGELVHGWTTENGYGRLKWDKPIPEVLKLGDALGVDLRGEPSACIPTQAKKKGIDEAVINAYSSKPTTGKKLIPSDQSLASMVFGKRS